MKITRFDERLKALEMQGESYLSNFEGDENFENDESYAPEDSDYDPEDERFAEDFAGRIAMGVTAGMSHIQTRQNQLFPDHAKVLSFNLFNTHASAVDRLDGGSVIVPELFGYNKNFGQLTGTMYSVINGATPTGALPSIGAAPNTYNEILNESANKPLKLKGLRLTYMGATSTVNALQKGQPLIVFRKDAAGTLVKSVIPVGNQQSAYQFNDNIIEVKDFECLIDGNVAIAVPIVKDGVIRIELGIDTQFDPRAALQGKNIAQTVNNGGAAQRAAARASAVRQLPSPRGFRK